VLSLIELSPAQSSPPVQSCTCICLGSVIRSAVEVHESHYLKLIKWAVLSVMWFVFSLDVNTKSNVEIEINDGSWETQQVILQTLDLSLSVMNDNTRWSEFTIVISLYI